MKIAMSGTFDIGNFGDILFPIVAKHMLNRTERVDVELFSYHRKSADSWCYDVHSLQDFPNRLPEADLVIVGGGHLLHFNPEMAENYYPADAAMPHPLGFWWLPAVAAKWAGVPVATHGISSDPRFPAWADPLMQAFVESVDYLTVRDTETAERLDSFGTKRCKIVPDSIFSISHVLQRGRHSPEFSQFKLKHGLGDRYLIIQPSDRLWKRRAQVLDYARRATELGWQVLELPIGFGIGNKPGFYGGAHGLIEVQDWPDPLLLAEVIANAEAAIGISLHLSIVASAYGIPVLRPSYERSSKFILLDGLPNMLFLDNNPELRGVSETEPDLTVAHSYRDALENHWGTLLGMAKAASTRSRERSLSGVWPMLQATPAAFRQLRNQRERLDDALGFAKRRRNYLMHHVRKSLYRRMK